MTASTASTDQALTIALCRQAATEEQVEAVRQVLQQTPTYLPWFAGGRPGFGLDASPAESPLRIRFSHPDSFAADLKGAGIEDEQIRNWTGEIAGLYFAKENTIWLMSHSWGKERAPLNVTGVFRHELGHAIDDYIVVDGLGTPQRFTDLGGAALESYWIMALRKVALERSDILRFYNRRKPIPEQLDADVNWEVEFKCRCAKFFPSAYAANGYIQGKSFAVESVLREFFAECMEAYLDSSGACDSGRVRLAAHYPRFVDVFDSLMRVPQDDPEIAHLLSWSALLLARPETDALPQRPIWIHALSPKGQRHRRSVTALPGREEMQRWLCSLEEQRPVSVDPPAVRVLTIDSMEFDFQAGFSLLGTGNSGERLFFNVSDSRWRLSSQSSSLPDLWTFQGSRLTGFSSLSAGDLRLSENLVPLTWGYGLDSVTIPPVTRFPRYEPRWDSWTVEFREEADPPSILAIPEFSFSSCFTGGR